jgi:hypothetical protein
MRVVKKCRQRGGWLLASAAAFAMADPAEAQEAPIVDSCLAGPFELSFDHTSSELSPSNIAILNNALANGAYCGNSIFIETLPSPNVSPALQRRRLAATSNYVQAHATYLTNIRLRISSKKSAFVSDEPERHILIWFGSELPE